MGVSCEIVRIFSQPLGLGFFFSGLAAGSLGAVALAGNLIVTADASGIGPEPLTAMSASLLFEFHGSTLLP